MAHRRNITNYNFIKNNPLNNIESNFSKIEKPISSVYNIYFNKEKLSNSFNKIPISNSSSNRQRKIPIFNTLFYSPHKINKKLNNNILFQKSKNYKSQKDICSIEYPSSYITNSKKEINNTIHPDVYIRKKSIFASPKRCFSEKNFKFNNKIGSSYLTLTPSKMANNKSIEKNNKNNSTKNQNIININLYNEKNNYIANNIINQIYMNKNKKNNNSILEKKNSSINSSITNNNNESIIFTERKLIPRRSNYSFYYCPNNSNKNANKGCINRQRNSKKKINYLPKVQRKPSQAYNSNYDYNESYIIKIQSVVRGYLLNKKLDKYLRQYTKINGAIKKIEMILNKKIFSIFKDNKKKKNYKFKNVYYSNKRQNSSNNSNSSKSIANSYNRSSTNRNNSIKKSNLNGDQKNIELQHKIKELITEKIELQNNYDNLKEFIRKYKELEKQNDCLKKEIEKLKLKNNDLMKQLNTNKRYTSNVSSNNNINRNKYRRYMIQKQNDIKIISTKRVDLIYRKYNVNKEIQKCEKNDFFTLGSDSKNNEDNYLEKESLKINKLKYLFEKKQSKNVFRLFKSFFKFYYNGLFDQNIMNLPINISNRISHKNTINRRYNNGENNNNLFNCTSIKTLSDNSSVFTERRCLNNLDLQENKMMTGDFFYEEENKKK